MRAYEKVLLVSIIALITALLVILADPFRTTNDAAKNAASGTSGKEKSVQQPSSKNTSRVARGAAESVAATPADRSGAARGIPTEAGRYPLCQPADKLRRLVDPENRVALFVDPAGHLALYGDARPETGAATDQSYDFLTGCLPQLTFVNYASVLVEGHGPVQAGADTVSEETTRTDDGSLRTVFTFEDGVRLQQRLRLKKGAVEVVYEISNDSREPKNVSLRTLVTPPPDGGRGAEGRPLFLVPDGEGGRAVKNEREVDGAELSSVVVPRENAPTGSSGRLTFEGRTPDLYAFAGALRLTATKWRRAPQVNEPLLPASSVAAYWLYKDLGPGDSANFGYRYEPTPRAGNTGSGE